MRTTTSTAGTVDPRRYSILMVIACSFFALEQETQAVIPPPDGGYPGANTAEGQSALLSLSTGGFNTALGFLSLESNTEGNLNTAVGAGALLANVGNQNTGDGTQNTAIGAGALLANTTGTENTANGAFALFTNTTGGFNTSLGVVTLLANTTGSANTAAGYQALRRNTTGASNTAIGQGALLGNTTGSFNTAIGINSLGDNTSGNNNIAIGAGAGSNLGVANNVISIGIAGLEESNSFYVGNVFETPIDPDNLTMAIDVHGKVGTPGSSRRFKENIKPMDKTSEVILALKPVTFHYKNDVKHSPRFGLIAEEVAEIDPSLVAFDKERKPYSVRYDQVDAMLLNEFLKEHKIVQEEAATIAALKETVASLTARLNEQTEQIRKISAQVDLNQWHPMLVRNHQ